MVGINFMFLPTCKMINTAAMAIEEIVKSVVFMDRNCYMSIKFSYCIVNCFHFPMLLSGKERSSRF